MRRTLDELMKNSNQSKTTEKSTEELELLDSVSREQLRGGDRESNEPVHTLKYKSKWLKAGILLDYLK